MPANVFSESSITPDEILAADSAEFVIRLVVGADYTTGPSRLIFDFTAMLGTSCPTLDINEASGYVEVYCDNPDVTYRKRIWEMKQLYFVDREHPASRESARMFVLDLSEGLKKGDVIEVHWGESTRGFGPGTKVTSVVPRPGYEGDVTVRYFDDPEAGLPDSGRSYIGHQRPEPVAEVRLPYRVKPRAPKRLRMLRQHHRALLIPHDPFWNVAEVDDVNELVDTSAQATKNEQGVFEFTDKNVQVITKKLPLIDHAPMEDVFEGMHLYWGDIHNHSAISIDCVQNARMDMMPDDLMRFARDRAGLDFYAVTDHHTPAAGERGKLQADQWQRIVNDAEAHHEPGRFITFPAFELSNPRGDVVFILKHPLPYEAINVDWADVRDAWKSLREHEYMSIPHFHGPGPLPEGTWWENPDLHHEPVIELLSDHGSYEREDVQEQGRADRKSFRWDRCGKFFLQNGYRYGFVGNSDDHKGHIGVNGLTAMFANSLDRDSIFEAYRSRRVYATSNARIKLIFTGNGQLMGSILPHEKRKEFHIDVVGEGLLKKIDLFRNGEPYKRFKPEGHRFQVTELVEEDEPSNWYVRVTQLDNHVAISSPIWFE